MVIQREIPTDGHSPSLTMRDVWLDCDPGHDDAMAIILAGHHPYVNVLGISTVAGNQTVSRTTRNALSILEAAALTHIRVTQGQGKPLMREAKTCGEIHGTSGLDGHEFPPLTTHPLPQKGVVAMADAIRMRRKSDVQDAVVIIATGCLTNVALFLVLYPEMKEDVEIVLMGGALGLGNTGPVAEFNIQVDPEAAKIVFESGVPLTMVPLEVTHTALVTSDVLRRIESFGSAFSAMVIRLLTFFAETYRTVFNFHDPPLHDPCAVAYVIDPTLFETKEMRVDIETCSPLSSGQTVCDVWGQTGRPKNVVVAMKMDVEKFFEMLVEALRVADGLSPMNK